MLAGELPLLINAKGVPVMNTPAGPMSIELAPELSVIPRGHSITMPISAVRWMVMAVIGREMFVTSLRSVLESEGKDFSATMSGKLKMVVQCLAVAGSLLYLEYARDSTAEAGLATARDILLWSAVVITLYSGYDYVIRAIKLFRTG